MSDVETDASEDDELPDDAQTSAHRKRFTMKSLGQIVDPGSERAATRPATPPAPPLDGVDRPAGRRDSRGSRRRLQEEVSGRAVRPDFDDDEQTEAEVAPPPAAGVVAALARAAANAVDEEDVPNQLVVEADPDVTPTDPDLAAANGSEAGGTTETAEPGGDPGSDSDVAAIAEPDTDVAAAPADAATDTEVVVVEAADVPADRDDDAEAAPDRDGSNGFVAESGPGAAELAEPDPLSPRGSLLDQPLVLSNADDFDNDLKVADAGRVDDGPTGTDRPLAQQMLREEVRPGGRVSDPHDVPGIVLNLAKDLPAAAAVSVVRIDEEIELVGNTIDPDVDPNLLATVFSGVFRTLQQATGMLATGPLGRVHDVVIEAEHMDLVLRPLGTHYYLLVLEDRRSPSANLSATRLHMAAVAPGLAATLAQLDALDG